MREPSGPLGSEHVLTTTRVAVDLGAPTVSIDRRIYGHFLEEIGRMISGGLFPEKGSTAPIDDQGYRADVWEACRDLGPVLLRWPGGCFADVYHWRDGVGVHRARSYPNRFWGHRFGEKWGPPVHNELGTDEFLALCRDWDCEPYLCANAGTGGAEEAAAWVEYVNRHATGHNPSLPRCRLWSIGNEQFGVWEVGHTTARDYARRYLRYREAMRAVDPSIETVLNGNDDLRSRWNARVLEVAAEQTDYLSVHSYLPQDYRVTHMLSPPPTSVGAWYSALSIGDSVLAKLEAHEATVRRVAGRSIPLAVDEWNLWWTFPQAIRPRPCLRDSLGAAAVLMTFQKRADLVRIANLSSIINLIASPVLTDRDHVARTSLFHVFRLFTAHAEERRIASTVVSGPTYSAERLKGIRPVERAPLVSVTATASADSSRAALFLLNRHHELELRVEIDYRGGAPAGDGTFTWVTGPAPMAENLPGRPAQVTTQSRVIDRGQLQELALPPRSIAVVTHDLAKA